MAFVPGIDVSVYDPVINWKKIRQHGIRFAYIRSSYGVSLGQTRMDTSFPSHWAGAKQAGVIRGAYHYLRAAEDGKAQAAEFLKIVKPEKGDLPPALDLEIAFNKEASNTQWIKNAEAWLSKVKQATGVTPVIYSTAAFLREKLSLPNGKAPAWATQYKIWVAHWTYTYGDNVKPLQAQGWSPWTFWQYSGERDMLDGITNDLGNGVLVDFDVFNGSIDQLYQLAGTTAPVATTYTVQAGDRLENIARQFNLSLMELVNANPQILAAGAHLTIPQPAGAGDAASDTTDSTDTAGPTDTAGVIEPIDVVRTMPPVMYTVKSGDTLSAISLRLGSSVKAIADANHIADPNLIFVGQVLIVPK